MSRAVTAAPAVATGQVWRSKKDPERRVKVGNQIFDGGRYPLGADWKVKNLATSATSAIFAFNLIRLYDLEQA